MGLMGHMGHMGHMGSHGQQDASCPRPMSPMRPMCPMCPILEFLLLRSQRRVLRDDERVPSLSRLYDHTLHHADGRLPTLMQHDDRARPQAREDVPQDALGIADYAVEPARRPAD